MNVTYYEDDDGKSPFRAWLKGINSRQAKSRIMTEITKLERGLLGDPKSIGSGVYEKKLNFDNGYRLYYGYDGPVMVVMLVGSTKDDQRKTIKLAKELWLDYKRQKAERVLERRRTRK